MLAALLAGAAGAYAQSVERRMIVSVLDGDGAPVTNLEPADFEIREDDVAREVLRVEPAGANRHVAILVDTSDATTRATSDLRRGLSAFVDGMHAGNEISIISFGGVPRIVVETTGDPLRLQRGVGRIFPRSGEAAYMLDAMYEVLGGFARRGTAIPVMVVITAEGVDYSNRRSREVLERIEQTGTALYTLSVEARRTVPTGADSLRAGGFSSQFDARQQLYERDLVMSRGTNDSGGRHRDLLASSAVERALLEVASELRNQYLVAYARPDTLIPPEEVRVSVDRPGLTARGVLLRSDETRNR